VAAAQAQAGDVMEAKATADMIGSARVVPGAHAAPPAPVGARAAAKAAVEHDEDATRQAEAYCAIAEAQARASELGNAKATAAQIKDPSCQARAYVALAVAAGKKRSLALAKDAFEQAAAAAADIADAEDKARIYGVIVAAQAQGGDLPGAVARVGKAFADPASRAEVLARAAIEFYATGK